MRAKIADLACALQGRFAEHHALMCRLHLDHIDHLEVMIEKLDAQLEAMMRPFRAQRDLLTSIPGIGELTFAAIISEIGVEVTEFFSTAAHLACWSGSARATMNPPGSGTPAHAVRETSIYSPPWSRPPGAPCAVRATSSPSTTATS